MIVYNEQMQPLENYDPSMGHVEIRTRIEHHNAVEAVPEQSHYEVVAEYAGGGKDVRKVIDVVGIVGEPAWDETVEYGVYIPYTAEELERINQPTIDDILNALLGVTE